MLKMNLQMFAEEGEPATPEITLDTVKSFLETNEDGKKFLGSVTQSVADKQLENWQRNNLDTIKQTAVKEHEDAKKHKSPEQVEIEELKAKFEKAENQRLLAENQSLVNAAVVGLELDSGVKSVLSDTMLGLCVSTDTEKTNQNVELMTKFVAAMTENFDKQMTNKQMQQSFGKEEKKTQATSDDPMKALGKMLGQLDN